MVVCVHRPSQQPAQPSRQTLKDLETVKAANRAVIDAHLKAGEPVHQVLSTNQVVLNQNLQGVAMSSNQPSLHQGVQEPNPHFQQMNPMMVGQQPPQQGVMPNQFVVNQQLVQTQPQQVFQPQVMMAYQVIPAPGYPAQTAYYPQQHYLQQQQAPFVYYQPQQGGQVVYTMPQYQQQPAMIQPNAQQVMLGQQVHAPMPGQQPMMNHGMMQYPAQKLQPLGQQALPPSATAPPPNPPVIHDGNVPAFKKRKKRQVQKWLSQPKTTTSTTTEGESPQRTTAAIPPLLHEGNDKSPRVTLNVDKTINKSEDGSVGVENLDVSHRLARELIPSPVPPSEVAKDDTEVKESISDTSKGLIVELNPSHDSNMSMVIDDKKSNTVTPAAEDAKKNVESDIEIGNAISGSTSVNTTIDNNADKSTAGMMSKNAIPEVNLVIFDSLYYSQFALKPNFMILYVVFCMFRKTLTTRMKQIGI